MNRILLPGLVSLGLLSAAAACSGDLTTPTSFETTLGYASAAISATATLRVRCERRGNRSRISLDGNNLSPRNGSFRGRVTASAGTFTSKSKRAVGDEVEFDFYSNPNDIAAGATKIPARFITARPGPDVIGEILNSSGVVVVRQGAECEFK